MDDLENKKSELKYWIERIGWTPKYFSKQFFIMQNEITWGESDFLDDQYDIDINQFYERFKKDISRGKNIKRLDTYLKFLFETNEFQKTGLIKPNFHYQNDFNDDFNKRMKSISKYIFED